jgi:hypothetical protein
MVNRPGIMNFGGNYHLCLEVLQPGTLHNGWGGVATVCTIIITPLYQQNIQEEYLGINIKFNKNRISALTRHRYWLKPNYIWLAH